MSWSSFAAYLGTTTTDMFGQLAPIVALILAVPLFAWVLSLVIGAMGRAVSHGKESR